MRLPDNATYASKRRAEFATRLAEVCPPSLADEIALVGSTAHGYADDESDLELNLWADTIPPLDERLNWLRAAGADEIRAEDAPRPDESHWIGFRIGGIPAEVGWQTVETAERQIETILSGAVSSRKTLVYAEIVVSAIPLRTAGHVARWQEVLAGYSDAVQQAIITEAVEHWGRSDVFPAARRLARRGEVLALTEMLIAEIDLAVRVLYAAHRRWEPSRKWTLTAVREFALDVPARIEAILGEPVLERRVALCAGFCLSAAELAAGQQDLRRRVAAETGDISAALVALRAEVNQVTTTGALDCATSSE